MATSIKSHTVTGVGCIALILFTYMIFGPQTKVSICQAIGKCASTIP